MKQIGENIKRLRKKHRWTQGEVVKRLGISTPAFSNIERGKTDINISRLREIANLFNVSIFEILYKPAELVALGQEEELNKCKDRLTEKDYELIRLQTKLITLYETFKSIPGLP